MRLFTAIDLSSEVRERLDQLIDSLRPLAQLHQGGAPISVHRGHSGIVDQGSPVTNPVPDERD